MEFFFFTTVLIWIFCSAELPSALQGRPYSMGLVIVPGIHMSKFSL